jgi:hypothetical protein
MKFRISISTEQLDYILACPDCPTDLRKQLELAKFKAANGYVKPAYEIKPREKKDLPLETKYKMATQYLERGQDIPEELIAAYNEYRYLNDLMSPEDMEEYEKREGF